MRNIVEYKDLLAFHPGYYIAETIEDMGMTQGEFATRMGTTPKTLSKLVNGQANITNDLTQKLSTMLGTSPDVWLNLQTAYDNKLIEIQQAKDLDAQKEIIDQIDYNFFKMVAGLPIVHSWKEKLLQLCKFLKVSDLRILAQPDFSRRSERILANVLYFR